MAYSVLLLGATTRLGRNVSRHMTIQAHSFSRVAILKTPAESGTNREAKDASVTLESIYGDLGDPASYRGFDIVVSTLEEALCAKQTEYIDAAFARGVKHFYPAECELSSSFFW